MKNTEQKQYSVSLVYTKTKDEQINTDLRVAHLCAINEHEALGRVINQIDDEMKDYVLVCKIVKEFKLKSE